MSLRSVSHFDLFNFGGKRFYGGKSFFGKNSAKSANAAKNGHKMSHLQTSFGHYNNAASLLTGVNGVNGHNINGNNINGINGGTTKQFQTQTQQFQPQSHQSHQSQQPMPLNANSFPFGNNQQSHEKQHKLSTFEQLVGNTPLVYLESISELAGCQVYGKCEFLNPGGSLKDRTALGIIYDAEYNNQLIRGQDGIIVEGTTGNTGTSLSLISNMFGYTPIICVPQSTVQEKKDRLKYYGAYLIEAPNVDPTHLNHFHSFAKRLTNEIKEQYLSNNDQNINIIYSNQHDNLANYRVHYNTTGPEVYKQTQGKISAFSCSMGTGGTLSGVSKYLLEQNNNIKICLTDPLGGYMVNYFNKNGELSKNGDSICEGTPGTRKMVSANAFNNENKLTVDFACEINDEEMINALDLLQCNESIMVGLSSGVNCAGAIKTAHYLNLKKDDILVTLLCDSGDNYVSKVTKYKENKENKENKERKKRNDRGNGFSGNGNNSENVQSSDGPCMGSYKQQLEFEQVTMHGNDNNNNNSDARTANTREEVFEGVIHPFEEGSLLAECVENVYRNGNI